MAQLNFNANEVEPAGDFSPIPAGKYLAVITGSEKKGTKAGNGTYIEFRFELIDGPYKGRQLWARLNLENPSKQAVQIARGELSALCRATGVMAPRDSLELHGIPIVVGVAVEPRSDSGQPTNVVRGYFKREVASGQPQQATTNTPPWRRG